MTRDATNATGVVLFVLMGGGVIRILSSRLRRTTPNNEPDIHVVWSTTLLLAAMFIKLLAASRVDPEPVEAAYIGVMTFCIVLALFSASRAIELRRSRFAMEVLQTIRDVPDRSRMVTWEFIRPSGERIGRLVIPAHYGAPLEKAYPDEPFIILRDGVEVFDSRFAETATGLHRAGA